MSMFGEVTMGMSRAVSDDEDDEFSLIKEDEDKKQKIHWLTDDFQDKKLTVDELIVADGQIASAFLFTYLVNHLNGECKKIALSSTKSELKVYLTNQEDASANNRSEFMQAPTVPASSSLRNLRTNFVYHVQNLNGKSYAICQMFNQIKTSEAYDWISQLWSRVEFKNVLTLCSQNSANYFGSSQEVFPCVKFISSDKTRDERIGSCVRLAEPNFIENLPAALINFCVLKNIPFISFVCYSRSLSVDLPSVKEFYNGVAQKLDQSNIFIDNDHSKKTLLQMNNIVSSVSGLYM